MGVSTNFYTIFGVKIGWNDDFHEAYNEVYNDEDTPFVLFECYGCEYMIFGEVLFDSGNARRGFEDGDSFKEIEWSSLAEMEAAYRVVFEKKFPAFYHLVNQPFKLMSLAHYS